MTSNQIASKIDSEVFDRSSELEIWLREAERKYQPFLDKSVRYHLSQLKKSAESNTELLAAKYDELTNSGASFAEKRTIGEKLERAEKALADITYDLNHLVVREMSEWVEYEDMLEIKNRGVHNAVGRPEILLRTYEKRN